VDIKFSAFIATSFDGFIARLNGKLDWLNEAAGEDKSEDYGYQQFVASVDCIVLGRNSFEKVAAFSQWPYEKTPVIVLSRHLKSIPPALEDKASLFSGEVELLAVELQSRGFKRVYVDGGATIQSFIRAELLDDITVTQIPVLLGKGIPLFAEVAKDVKLKLLRSQAYASGFVQSSYQILRYAAKYFD